MQLIRGFGLVVIYGILLTLIVWGWFRWFKLPKPPAVFPILSLFGFIFATASAALAISSMLYARSIGGFAYYDPRLLRVFQCGFLLSFVAIILASTGMRRPSAWRWPALAFGVVTMFFWFATAVME